MLPFLREWFAVNHPLILFVYGQTFFVAGLAIALQSRKNSRLPLARSLSWLAAFGLLHGFNEWGDLFLPLQRQFLSDPAINLLSAFQLILLALSFACLFQFGIELLRPLPKRWIWLRAVPASVFILWLLGPFWLGLVLIPNNREWYAITNSLARYLLCLPGGLLAGLALTRQTAKQIRPLNLLKIEQMLRLAAAALVAYAFLGGLLTLPAPLFPASWLNTENFIRLFIIPPQVFRSLAGLALALAIVRTLEVFDLETERLIHRMEEAQVIAAERERLSRDLHDGALQQIYAAGLLAQSLQKQATPPLKDGLDQLVMAINHSIQQLRQFLTQMQQPVETIELIPTLENFLAEIRPMLAVETQWEITRPLQLTPEQINHILAFTREAISNAIRHSDSERIEVFAQCRENRLRLSVRDFGRGLPETIEAGFGLRNMGDRAHLLGGELSFESQPGKGTTVILEIPLEKNP